MNEDSAHSPACRACREPIRPGAQICPHCGSAQSKTRTLWHRFAELLKWVGGIATVISLVMAVKTLHGHYQEWQDRQEAVGELVAAAEWLVRTQNYRQAWGLYAEADDLAPGSARIRKARYDMAIAWIQDFVTGNEAAGEILDQLAVVLYRSLPGADRDETATILAHVARIQAKRRNYKLPVFVDDLELLEQALEASPGNLYANAYMAHRLLLQRPITPEDIGRAQRHFSLATRNEQQRAWVRDLQLGRLVMLATQGRDETAVAAMQAFLQTAHQMLLAGESPPGDDLRTRILDSYGHMGSGERVEEYLGLIPPEHHLAVNRWLREGFAYRNERSGYPAQQDYLVARLLEESGEKEQALDIYRDLLKSQRTYRRLDPLVDAAVQRLTGSATARSLQRTYIDDPVDENDPWAFHLATLQHFPEKWKPLNFEQALEWFVNTVGKKDRRLQELIEAMPGILARVDRTLEEGAEREKQNGFTSGYSRGHYENVRANWSELMLLYSLALREADLLDRAVAIAGDTAVFIERQGPEFTALAARVDYQKAITLASRAGRDNVQTDRGQALDALESSVKKGIVRSNVVSWDDIKGKDFSALSAEPRYLELVRGR